MKEIKLPPSKNKYGYTKQEILSILRSLKISHKKFWSKFGVNTCALVDNVILYYHCDILSTIYCCLENRDKTEMEWD